MTQIERRQAHIRRIRAKSFPRTKEVRENVATDPEVHHNIGKSENYPEHVGTFVQRNTGDPAVKVFQDVYSRTVSHKSNQNFIQKLKNHILPRIKAALAAYSTSPPNSESSDWNAVLFKHDRIYRHNIMRINFTSYDVRRCEDVIHPGTQHCNVMVLASESGSIHPYSYARVLGIFHANVIYIGEGNFDYHPYRLEFLWVRWYELQSSGGWPTRRLDEIRFPAMTNDDAFGFLDPSDVLRACHIVPCLRNGKTHSDNLGISHLSQDAHDWRSYLVNRYVTLSLGIVWSHLL